MRPKKVILCVDDNEQDLSVLVFTLRTNGFRVFAATSGQEAIVAFSERVAGPPGQMVDLVLADHAMPKMSGDELVIKLKQIYPYTPMVIIGDIEEMNGKVHSADALLNKRTTSPEELLERIRVMVARKRGPRKGFRHCTGEKMEVV